MLETMGEAVDDVDNFITARNGEIAIGAEIILHINNNENIGFLAHRVPHIAAIAAAQPLKAGNFSTIT
jgi:hypothetical protein